MSDLFKNMGVQIELKRDFNSIRETLSRIGIANSDNTLFQSCHIFHKKGKYAIMHFKEMFAFDGKPTTIEPEDIARRNTIVDLLAQWDLVEPLNLDGQAPRAPMANIKVVRFADKANWTFVAKYTIGAH